MNTNPLTKGVVSESCKGVGTVTDEMVEKRAVELALINGRLAKDVSETDYAQAKRELTGESDIEPQEEALNNLPETEPGDPLPDSFGRKVPNSIEDDEDDEGRSIGEQLTEAVYDEMFNLNAKGPLFAVQKLSPLINRGGSVVLTTSVANVKGMPTNASYGAAKAALRSFARTLAAELIPREIRVNAVTPGPIDTPIIDKVFTGKDEAAQIREKMIGMVPMKRWGKSEEIAKAVLFLAFDATFTTGAEIPVDGGWSQL